MSQPSYSGPNQEDVIPQFGTFKAWISTGLNLAGDTAVPDQPSNTFTESTVPYYLPDGTTEVAANWAGLTSGNLTHAISMNPALASNTSAAVWTGTIPGGTASSENCTDWTSDINGPNGIYGYTAYTTTAWTDCETDGTCYTDTNAGTHTPCNNTAYLYCFQQ